MRQIRSSSSRRSTSARWKRAASTSACKYALRGTGCRRLPASRSTRPTSTATRASLRNRARCRSKWPARMTVSSATTPSGARLRASAGRIRASTRLRRSATSTRIDAHGSGRRAGHAARPAYPVDARTSTWRSATRLPTRARSSRSVRQPGGQGAADPVPEQRDQREHGRVHVRHDRTRLLGIDHPEVLDRFDRRPIGPRGQAARPFSFSGRLISADAATRRQPRSCRFARRSQLLQQVIPLRPRAAVARR